MPIKQIRAQDSLEEILEGHAEPPTEEVSRLEDGLDGPVLGLVERPAQ